MIVRNSTRVNNPVASHGDPHRRLQDWQGLRTARARRRWPLCWPGWWARADVQPVEQSRWRRHS